MLTTNTPYSFLFTYVCSNFKHVNLSLHSEESRTQVAPPPDTADLPNGHLYTYETFPLLDPKLFSKRSHQSHDSNEVPSATQVHQRTKAEKQRSTELLQIATDSPEKWSKLVLMICHFYFSFCLFTFGIYHLFKTMTP